MAGLKSVLERASGPRFGGTSAVTVKALRAYRKQMFAIFLIVFATVVVGVATGAFSLIRFIDEPRALAEFSSAIGLTVGGGIEVMRRIWKEWSQATLILILIEDATEAQVKALIDKLIRKL